jgi:quinol monooxygenase YgiN
MPLTRRNFIATASVSVIGGRSAVTALASNLSPSTTPHMYGIIGKMTVQPGQRDAFAAILLEGTGGMPGCLSYIIAKDTTDPDGLWITEVWDSQASHQASLKLPAVQAAIAKGRPMIASFSNRVETTPLGGIGLIARP